ncbi:hypothetical protein EHS25_004550 [Saitozyma podzolica]|jgi:hypothetical protein|uniref:Uncharacterized protein n=1 Tax=Saitozyma podzolica TaxID=1890683 RepID=A0A427YUC5_9TREE|nr:hypothetical protein EHS25_004550 [Saitozyma podzolica]
MFASRSTLSTESADRAVRSWRPSHGFETARLVKITPATEGESYKLSIALLKRPPEEGLSVEGTLPGRRRCQDFTAGMSQLLDTIAGKVGGQQWETLSWTSRSDSSIKLEASRIPLPFPLDGEVIETRTASVVWASEIEAIEVAVSQSTPRRLSLGDGSYIVDIDLQFGGANGAGDAA